VSGWTFFPTQLTEDSGITWKDHVTNMEVLSWTE